MPSPIPTGVAWQKSSYSGGNGGNGCVEVAALPGGEIAVRDTKDRGRAPHRHSGEAWRAFLTGVRAREFGA
jgi:hypothetical protein